MNASSAPATLLIFRSTGALFLALFVAAVISLIAVPILGWLDAPLWTLPLPFLCTVAGILILWDTQLALLTLAFAIVPLNVLQVEIWDVTVNFPELLILFLLVKEGLRFILRGEKIVRDVGWPYVLLFVGASLVGVAVGFWQGNSPQRILQDWRQFIEYIVLFVLLIHRVSSWHFIRAMLFAFALGSVITAGHGIYQRLTGTGIPLDQQMNDLVYFGGFRAGSFYGATALGALMVFGIGSGLGVLMSLRSRVLQLSLWAMIGVMGLAAVFTQTRASWLALAILFTYVFLFLRKTFWVLLVTLGILVAGAATVGPIVYQRMTSLEISHKERSLLERMRHYETAWHIFRSHPWVGLGWGCYFDEEIILRNNRYVPVPQPKQRPKKEPTTHSAYLQILVRGGILALGTFSLMLAVFLYRFFRAQQRWDRRRLEYGIVLALNGTILAYLFHTAFENFFQWPVMSQSFWFFLALGVLAYLHIKRIRPLTELEA